MQFKSEDKIKAVSLWLPLGTGVVHVVDWEEVEVVVEGVEGNDVVDDEVVDVEVVVFSSQNQTGQSM